MIAAPIIDARWLAEIERIRVQAERDVRRVTGIDNFAPGQDDPCDPREPGHGAMQDPHDDLSRQLNAHFGGDPGELFSARCWRLRWSHPKWAFLRLIVDRHFYRARGERNHCRNAYLRERAERGLDGLTPDDVVRRLG